MSKPTTNYHISKIFSSNGLNTIDEPPAKHYGAYTKVPFVQHMRAHQAFLRLKGVEFIDLNPSSQYLIFYNSGRLISYSKRTWEDRPGGTVKCGKYLIKSDCFSKKDVLVAFNQVKDVFRAQFSFSDISDAFKGIFDIVDVLKNFHRSPRTKHLFLSSVSKAESCLTHISNVEDAATAQLKACILKFQNFWGTFINKLFSLLNIALDVSSCIMTGFSSLTIVKMLVSLYLFVRENANLFSSTSTDEEFFDCPESFSLDGDLEAQSMESLLLSLSTMFLPKEVYEMFRRMTTFSNSKLMDDFSCFHEFYSLVINFLTKLFSYIPLPAQLRNGLTTMISSIPLGKDHVLIDRAFSLFNRWKKDKTLLIDSSFVTEVKSLSKELGSSAGILEWSRRSAKVASIYTDFKTLERCLAAYEDASRVEPACFVFEGPAGVMKSYFTNMILSALNETRYVHTVPPSMGGKEFWDMYNNEEIVVMDDIGQQDISQWRTLINLVSPLKFPLDCARAELKDTKYFSSSKMFVTTNNFMNIQGLTKQDGIACLPALWRRGYVFKFATVRVDTPDGPHLKGRLLFYHYDLSQNRFINAFPSSFNYLKHNLTPILEVNEDVDRSTIVTWFCRIIKTFDYVKRSQKTSSGLSPSELDTIRASVTEQIELINPTPCFIPPSPNYYDPETLGTLIGPAAQNIPNAQTPLLGIRVVPKDEDSSLIRQSDDDVELPSPQEGWLELTKSYYEDFIGSVKDHISSIFCSVTSGASTLWKAADWSLTWRKLLLSFIPAGIFGGLMAYFAYLRKSHVPDYASMFSSQTSEGEPLPTPVVATMKQVLQLRITCRDGSVVNNFGMMSGHYIIVPAHMTLDDFGYVTVFQDAENDHRLLDHHKFDVVYRNLNDDVMILKLDVHSLSPFKNLSHFLQNKEKGGDYYLANCFGAYEVSGITKNYKGAPNPIVYHARFKNNKKLEFKPPIERTVTYSLEAKGLCGTILMNSQSGIKGMHVAGKAGVTGASILWSEQTKQELYDILKHDKYLLPTPISDRLLPGFSGIKLDKRMHISVPSSSNIVESPLSGVFENTKTPAELSKYGFHTTKTIAKKSFKPIQSVSQQELEFATSVLQVLIPKFGDITEREVVKGNEFLAGVNKDSSNGFGCEKEKEAYFDFKQGEITPLFRDELSKFCEDVKCGKVPLDRVLSVECLKDETRDERKEGEPRSFRISTVHTQYLTKLHTGDMVAKIIKNRTFNQVMVGVNPYKEWANIYENLSRCAGVWAGDIGTWDGGMLSQAQRCINEIMLEKYTGAEKDLLGFLLGLIPACPVAVQDDLYITTHSMPSGNFLTAIYNSLVNRFYTAMWYRRIIGPDAKVSVFLNEIVDYVYGDDKMNGVRNKHPRLNALTMRDFFVSIGMKLTTASKEEITKPYEDLKELSFLKRKFLYHPSIGRVMCPLDIATIYSTMNWVDSSKDEHEVLRGKISSFQREMYLHPHLFKIAVSQLEEACEERNIPFTRLSEDYLLYIFTQGVNELQGVYGIHEQK